MSFKLSNVDLFRKVPRDLTQATTHGGILSLAAVVLLSAVMLLEIWTYAAGETRSKIVLDQNTESKLQINFAMSFPELPCRFANVEVWDYLGNAKLDVSGSLQRKVLTGEHGTEIKHDYVNTEIQHHKDENAQLDLNSDHVIDGSHANMAAVLGQSDYTFVLFYVEWCAYCKTVMPVWHDLGLRVRQSGMHKTQIARVDCDKSASLCTETKIAAYPTFMMFKGQHPFEKEYNGHRNVESLMAYIHQNVAEGDQNKAELKEQWHEGCHLSGTLEVNRVPGNFHVTAKSSSHNFDEKSTNASHVIHSLTFGPKMQEHLLRKIPEDVRRNINPLANRRFVNHAGHISHEHHIKIVSTHYETGTLIGHGDILGYQLATSNHQFDANPNVPEARFSYDLSPTAVVISQAGRRWYEFITSLCAIIGGTFVVFSLINGMLGTVRHKVGPRDRADLLSPSGLGKRG